MDCEGWFQESDLENTLYTNFEEKSIDTEELPTWEAEYLNPRTDQTETPIEEIYNGKQIVEELQDSYFLRDGLTGFSLDVQGSSIVEMYLEIPFESFEPNTLPENLYLTDICFNISDMSGLRLPLIHSLYLSEKYKKQKIERKDGVLGLPLYFLDLLPRNRIDCCDRFVERKEFSSNRQWKLFILNQKWDESFMSQIRLVTRRTTLNEVEDKFLHSVNGGSWGIRIVGYVSNVTGSTFNWFPSLQLEGALLTSISQISSPLEVVVWFLDKTVTPSILSIEFLTRNLLTDEKYLRKKIENGYRKIEYQGYTGHVYSVNGIGSQQIKHYYQKVASKRSIIKCPVHEAKRANILIPIMEIVLDGDYPDVPISISITSAECYDIRFNSMFTSSVENKKQTMSVTMFDPDVREYVTSRKLLVTI